ncbi:uncharacterized protein LOC132044554 [Lycium ferocissimum]|uniref:uncharacterized protein LOC132044554 n=1 Tax=Lycium ferocissimum TaxID=112874 RepID=UPI002815132A|nr:uncharacterized protein LOC132044554 [Lycium ferocissimum]
MDFMGGLPKMLGKFDSIWDIVDRLTKTANFILVRITYNAGKLAKIYIHFGSQWDQFLPLAEFAYSNSYHSSIDMAPFEVLYGKRCRSHIDWFDAFKLRTWSTNLLRESLEKVKVIQAKLLAAQSRQKGYADRKV